MAAVQTETLVDRAAAVLSARRLADADTPAMLMVSGGSDSTALAYIACELRERGALGQLAMLHVNHRLRGEDADEDARFVAQLAELLDVPLFSCEIDIAGEAQRTGENVEAVARRERYLAANEALESLCLHAATPLADGRILTAHTAECSVRSASCSSSSALVPPGVITWTHSTASRCSSITAAAFAAQAAHVPVVKPLLNFFSSIAVSSFPYIIMDSEGGGKFF